MKNKIVIKSNALIEASYRLSSQEQKIILALASKLKNHDSEFLNYNFSIKEFANITGTRVDAKYNAVKKLTAKLLRRAFTINEPDGPLQLSWLSAAKYYTGQGCVSLRFDPGLKPYLLQLKKSFTKFDLCTILQLKSAFSIRIYELLKQYENIGERSFLIEELKSILGISKNKYKLYGHFKARVLNIAKKELCEKTDILFDFEETKIGRGVGKIRFIIEKQALPQLKKQKKSLAATKPTEHSSLQKMLLLLPKPYRDKISVKKLLQKTLKKQNEDYVVRNIFYTNDKSNSTNYRVYLAKALDNDYGLAYVEDCQSRKETNELQQQNLRQVALQQQNEMSKIDQERENREKARNFMQSITPETMQKLEKEALNRLSPESLQRYNNNHYTGIFEFKRRLEDVVMEQIGIKAVPANL